MRLNEVVYTDAQPVEGYGPGFFRIGGKIHPAPVLTGARGTRPWGGYDDAEREVKLGDCLERLGKHSLGKSCLYINKLADVDLDVLEEMIRRDWEEMKRRYPE